MSCHENELQREREYEEFIEMFDELDNDISDFLQGRDRTNIKVLGAVLSKHLINVIRMMGGDKDLIIEIMNDTWDSVVEVEEMH